MKDQKVGYESHLQSGKSIVRDEWIWIWDNMIVTLRESFLKLHCCWYLTLLHLKHVQRGVLQQNVAIYTFINIVYIINNLPLSLWSLLHTHIPGLLHPILLGVV